MTTRKLLQIVLVLSGAGFLLIYPMAIVWPSGWAWHPGAPAASDYFMMIVAVYAVLGLFLIRAALDPAANRSLIWFAAWSSLVHAALMAVQARAMPGHGGHLIGDVPALLVVAVALGWLNHADRRGAA